MRKPTRTALAIRAVMAELSPDSRINVSDIGLVTDNLEFPDVNTESHLFAREYQIYNLARKREPDAGSYDPQPALRASLSKWVDSEWNCRVVNQHGRYFSPINLYDKLSIEAVLARTKRRLADLLCDVWPDFQAFTLTSGATSSARRRYCHPSVKATGYTDPQSRLGHNLACNKDALPFVREILELHPFILNELSKRRFNIIGDIPIEDRACDVAEWLCQGSIAMMDHVPKNVKEVRLIAKSGGMLASVQKTLGSALNAVLLSLGIDLRDQTVNQEWARLGSISGQVATVDLSSASDNIALKHLDLFPPRWQEYFKALRDTSVSVKGTKQTHRLEKIAGMGNGFIFELETLLFYVLSESVCVELNEDTSLVSCYGDDIIIPSQAAPLLYLVFKYMGFHVNEDKSYHTGPFRESCGKHYHNGNDVTPFHMRGDMHTVCDTFHFVNGIAEWSNRTGFDLQKSYKFGLNLIPPRDRHLVPVILGSRAGLHHDWCKTIKPPVYKWSSDLQRMVLTIIRWSTVTVDEGDRYPCAARLHAALSVLERGDSVIEGNSRNLLILKGKGNWPIEYEPVSLQLFREETEKRSVLSV